MLHKYQKKPIIVEAAHFDDQEKAHAIAVWCDGSIQTRQHFTHPQRINNLVKVILINTLEGEMRADPDDFVIKGVKGEFYPCKPDIFEESYDRLA